MTIRLFRSNAATQYDYDAEHPESSDRIYAIEDQLLASGIESICEHADAVAASKAILNLAHDPHYVEDLIKKGSEVKEGEQVWLDQDTCLTHTTLDAALLSAGAGCNAVDWVMSGTMRRGFCLTRPPGHHALYDKAMGFCFFNNIAVAARYALQQYNLQRVAIVDFDVHHGNGTEHIVEGDERILFCSSYQHPFYPHRGASTPASNIITVPLDAGTNGAEFRESVAHWFEALKRFKPELILVSAGFDAHAQDPMAHLRLVEEDYYWITQRLIDVADTHCDGRVVSMLEGGYDGSALGRSVVAHLKAMSAKNIVAV